MNKTHPTVKQVIDALQKLDPDKKIAFGWDGLHAYADLEDIIYEDDLYVVDVSDY